MAKELGFLGALGGLVLWMLIQLASTNSPNDSVNIPRNTNRAPSKVPKPTPEALIPPTNRTFAVRPPPRPPDSVKLTWDYADTNSITGFRIYLGWTTGQWSENFYVGVTNSVVIDHIQQHPYAFAVSAIGTNGVESPLSNPGWYHIPNTNGTDYVSNGTAFLFLVAQTNRTYNIDLGDFSTYKFTNKVVVTNTVGVIAFPVGTNNRGVQKVTVH